MAVDRPGGGDGHRRDLHRRLLPVALRHRGGGGGGPGVGGGSRARPVVGLLRRLDLGPGLPAALHRPPG